MSAALEAVSVIRSGRAILDAATAACAPGCFTALCGPNGAGKTTALSVLSGSLPPDRGEARLDGEKLSDLHRLPLARRRAVVSQASALSFPFQVHEVVAMGRAPHQGLTSLARDREIVSEALSALALDDLAERNYLTLSGGERKRVDIARALAQVWEPAEEGRTRWLFLDEPTAALDLKHQIALMRRLCDLASKGWGVVAVLHDLHLVHAHADAVWMFRQGQIAETGPAAQVLTPGKIQSVFDLDAPFRVDQV